jgi:hypothetical protein
VEAKEKEMKKYINKYKNCGKEHLLNVSILSPFPDTMLGT